ncbi:hypothetical protein [Clostridium saccharobutylicum]|nr:hypothetical protein [Clostridium saccharobutylicum]AQR91961.1 hypothetical protein CLOSC_36890 [Clostridium saccharobutylicum]AQS01863.1 hypothetical protein CSACC_36940 [Clostridium saccharobutylicum]AQS15846.1 hypothetical protein CLOSACC_36940 [Clostridium saccharobutylicum]MBA2903452.1 putative bacteriocin precursor [Clostridium saccharobutylicum]MBA8788349.1 putative bacteriocin precursor [Clostridium saccharobutylicum]
MKKVSLGKKNDFEKGTFMAYACNCNCFNISCGTCTNCSKYKKNDVQGFYALSLVNNSKIEMKSMAPMTMLGA